MGKRHQRTQITGFKTTAHRTLDSYSTLLILLSMNIFPFQKDLLKQENEGVQKTNQPTKINKKTLKWQRQKR